MRGLGFVGWAGSLDVNFDMIRFPAYSPLGGPFGYEMAVRQTCGPGRVECVERSSSWVKELLGVHKQQSESADYVEHVTWWFQLYYGRR